MDFRLRYGDKAGVRSSSVTLSNELRDEIDTMYGAGQRSAFLERAGWLLLALLSNDQVELDDWLEWAERNMNDSEWDRLYDGRFHFGPYDPYEHYDE